MDFLKKLFSLLKPEEKSAAPKETVAIDNSAISEPELDLDVISTPETSESTTVNKSTDESASENDQSLV